MRLGHTVRGELFVEAGQHRISASELLPGQPPLRLQNVVAFDAGEREAFLERAHAAARSGWGVAIDELEPLGPSVFRPTKMLAVGRNYASHASEAGLEVEADPSIFSKLPSALTGHGGVIAWSEAQTSQVDWEAELAAVIGRRTSAVSEAEALEYVFGFTACNDVSARDIQFRAGAGTTELGLSKNLDTFCPLGPVIVTADEIENPQALLVSSELNGQAMQSALTSTMIRPVAELISYISRFITLEPGDVLLTGTPAGTGAFREPPIFLRDGDVVSVAVEGIGRLTNRCQVRVP